MLILALCTAAMFWLALNAALNGARVDVVLAPLIKPKRLWWPAGGMLAAWVYKIVIS